MSVFTYLVKLTSEECYGTQSLNSSFVNEALWFLLDLKMRREGDIYMPWEKAPYIWNIEWLSMNANRLDFLGRSHYGI